MDTPRLVLRRASPDDEGALFAAYASGPEVARYMTWRVHSDPGMTREFGYRDEWGENPLSRLSVAVARPG